MTRELAIDQPFDLALSLTMGQAFQWQERPDGWFSGVLGENLIHIRQTDAGVEYRVGGTDGERPAADEDDELLRRYFREDTDNVAAIYADISSDPKMDTIMREFPGLRLLRQAPWECAISYLCTARSGVHRTADMIENIATSFGTAVNLDGDTRYTLPTAEYLMSNSQEASARLDELRLGLNRSSNIIVAANQVCDGMLDWEDLRCQSYAKVKQRLKQSPGIGDKTADCIALFALDQLEAFPVDRWVWRAITEAYPEWGFPEKAEPTDRERREAAERARLEFGEYAGYANQYLFFWRRQFGEERLSFADRWHGKFRITPPDGRELDDEYLDDLRYEYLARKYLS